MVRKSCTVFMDLEITHGRVASEELWYCIMDSRVAEKYVKVVQDKYEDNETVVTCAAQVIDVLNLMCNYSKDQL